MLYCTYDEYLTAGGTVPEAAFGVLCSRASRMIDAATFGRAAPAARTRCAPRRRRSPCPRCAGSRPSFLPPPFVIYQLVSKKDSTLPQFCQGAAWIFPAI